MRSGCYAVSLVLVATLSLGCGSCRDTRAVAVPIQPDLVAPGYAVTAIVFVPALPTSGTLSITHESGWTHQGVANPSGSDVRIPAGPANLRLLVDGVQYGFAIKVAVEGGEVVWRWRERC